MMAQFMQGRKGDISQRHYFLPKMNEHQEKWNNIWKRYLQDIKYKTSLS